VEIIYSDEAQRDIDYWKKSGNKIVQRKIQQLLNAIKETTHDGIGKPEPLHCCPGKISFYEKSL